MVYHKKSGLWLSPGGHIDWGENLWQAVNLEISEELGMINFFKESPRPFLFTTVDINNPKQICKKHYDIWYLMDTNGDNFNINLDEFFETRWLDIDEAKKITGDEANKKAFGILKLGNLG